MKSDIDSFVKNGNPNFDNSFNPFELMFSREIFCIIGLFRYTEFKVTITSFVCTSLSINLTLIFFNPFFQYHKDNICQKRALLRIY